MSLGESEVRFGRANLTQAYLRVDSSIIHEAENLDIDAVDHLESALENFSKTHEYYLKS